MINVMTATGSELDKAGCVLHKLRAAGESDDSYRARLMDETPADGGAAFGEFKQAGHVSIKAGGISVRDYFASDALKGLLSWSGNESGGSYHSNSDPDRTAKAAYLYADAMLKARAQ